jgi:hypothetical protein
VKLINNKEIVNVFNLLNSQKIEYILLRNIDNELTDWLTVGKDIDILVHKKDELKFIDFFNLHGYSAIKHPFRNDIFLYGSDKFEFKYNNNNNILFDLNFQILVKSLDAGQWIPLDNNIQLSAWKNKRLEQQENGISYWTLCYEDEFICLVARSIFDKKEFQEGYTKRIINLLPLIDRKSVISKLELIFFKFTPYLMKLIEKKRYPDIIKKYLAFREY